MLAQLALRQFGKVAVTKEHFPAGGFSKPEDGAPESGLAAARLAHEPEGFASVDIDGDAIDSPDVSKVHFEIAD